MNPDPKTSPDTPSCPRQVSGDEDRFRSPDTGYDAGLALALSNFQRRSAIVRYVRPHCEASEHKQPVCYAEEVD